MKKLNIWMGTLAVAGLALFSTQLRANPGYWQQRAVYKMEIDPSQRMADVDRSDNLFVIADFIRKSKRK